ncbi:hypothetical protein [Inquilinus limosus]|uniref:Uncharacterized protein n=1 Tax=Inquilinus limosus TaxID=171674 RepID=A0A211Z7X8_9PROT|nr:hypothetical protein [Inquilinus limosus]OWJ61351.1 hypothetical protein BWR60_31380 [Inquilinus limosus]
MRMGVKSGPVGAFLAALVVLPAWAGPSYQSPEVSCPPQDDGAKVQRFDSLEAMPEPIWRSIAAALDPEVPTDRLRIELPDIIAPRDAKWQVTDSVEPGKPLAWRRFIRGFSVETRPHPGLSPRKVWYVWLEHGGMAYTLSVSIFKEGRTIKPVALFRGHEDTLCSLQATFQDLPFEVYKL